MGTGTLRQRPSLVKRLARLDRGSAGVTDECQQLREQNAALTALNEEYRAQRDYWLRQWRDAWTAAHAPCDCTAWALTEQPQPTPLRRVA